MRRNIETNFGTDTEEFETYVGRKPRKGEMDEWVRLLRKGIDSQLDWGCLCSCAAECFNPT